MSFNLETIERLSQSLINSLKRFPMASFSAFLLTIILISLIELEFYQTDSEIVIMATKIAFVASLGIVFFPALRLLYPNFLVAILGLGALAWYYYILPVNISDSHNHIFFRHALLILSFFLMLIWSPFISVKISNKNIWEWTQHMILALFATILFSLILYAGLSLAIYAIDKLFDIGIANRRYEQLAVMVFGLYGVNFFLSQMPKYILLLQARTYTKIEIIFTKYILTPLAIGYFLILFAYDIKILINMEFPKGILAWITVAFSVVAIATYLFWTPLWNEKNEKYKKYICVAVIMQTIMLGISIWIRIDEYGFTESRYFIVLFGAWSFLMSLYFLLIKSANYKWLFMSLSLLLIGSQFGKYSASHVSKYDQLGRLEKILQTSAPISEELDIESKYKISNLISYLSHNYGKESLSSLLPKIIQKYNATEIKHYAREDFAYFATNELGFKFINEWEWKEFLRNNKQEHKILNFRPSYNRDIVKIDGYEWLTNFYYSIGYEKINRENNITLLFKSNNLYLLDHNRTLINMNLNSLVDFLIKEHNETTLNYYEPIISNKMEYIFKNEQIESKLIISNISIEDGNISYLNCNVLWKKNTSSKTHSSPLHK
jgi:hypothetical protein